ncbi:FAD-dependent tricarballylate dehydrogenase TcuA [Rhodobacter maris]|uniref:Precorrin 3B synthase CobZ n=1 Tax=Rhodobacter maris TaxID=446682 RepID=A0A285RX17_9RHOB|nr:FAD-dependent tricarballylate dehydrogenase TcuA [Rhodobacter maris]SOB99094.1 precorrin 3B synthase CobZ [Rhodobacter maris]
MTTPARALAVLPASTGVLVIGAGLAGLCAAIAAREAGASVVLLDAAPEARLGGNARHGRNIRCAHATETEVQRDAYPVAEFAADLGRLAGADPGLAAVLAQGSADLADWLMAQGVRLEPWAEGHLPYSRRTVFLRGGGQAMVNALLRRARTLGVALFSEARVEALDPALLDPAATRPFEIVVARPGGAHKIAAGAVVLAAGGTVPDHPHIVNRGTPEQAGAPVLWALGAGARAAGRPGDGHFVAVDARAPKADAGIVSRVDGMHLGLVLGADGQRFYDEAAVTSPARHSVAARALRARTDPRGWIVLGAEAARALPPLLLAPIRATSARLLAEECGIDPAGLTTTLTTPFDPPRSVAPDLTPPFHAIPIVPGLGFSRHGLAIDAQARVQLQESGVAPRFFAAGTAVCGAVLGEGYLSGAGLAIAAVFGRIAGQAAAQTVGPGDAAPAMLRSETVPCVEATPQSAARALNICNTCGFCTGLCAVFPAAGRRPALTPGDLRHLAHLCHDCRSCLHDCQYAPPHALSVNLPATLAAARVAEYRGEGRGAIWLFFACLIGLPLAALICLPWAVLFGAQTGPGAFYAVLPHPLMAGGAGGVFGFALLVLAFRLARYWRASRGPGAPVTLSALRRGLADALSLRNLGDCEDRDGALGQGRRHAHHLLAGGFLLTFLATVAGFFAHLAGHPAPYPVLSAPVLLGTLGGLSMLAGLLLFTRGGRAIVLPKSAKLARIDRFARVQLATLAGTGLALLALRETPLMGLALLLHLGAVAGFALLLPFGKLAHGAFRTLSLIRHAAEEARLLDKRRRPPA